jgi:F0F1-type ATP synthase assembly protein I
MVFCVRMLKKSNFKIFYALSFAWQLGFLIVIPIGGFIFLGSLLDRIFNTQPMFLIIGLLAGLIITVYEIYHLLIPLIKDKEDD